jgi:hypothetical protein
MLGELSQVARAEQADLLVYLLEMAYTESNDLLSGKVQPQLNQVKRHEPGRVPMKPAGKIKFE